MVHSTVQYSTVLYCTVQYSTVAVPARGLGMESVISASQCLELMMYTTWNTKTRCAD
jgi:hypothetical protein